MHILRVVLRSAGRSSAAVAVGIAGCGGQDDRAVASCANGVQYEGVYYEPDRNERVDRLEPVGQGTVPTCEGDPASGDPVQVVALRGVPPEAANAVEGRAGIFLAAGYPLEVTAHPLHSNYYAAGKPRRTRCRRPFRFDGEILAPPLFLRGFLIDNGPRWKNQFVRLHHATKFRGLERAGIPYVEKGAAVRLRGRRCPRGTIVADEVRRLR